MKTSSHKALVAIVLIIAAGLIGYLLGNQDHSARTTQAFLVQMQNDLGIRLNLRAGTWEWEGRIIEGYSWDVNKPAESEYVRSKLQKLDQPNKRMSAYSDGSVLCIGLDLHWFCGNLK